VTPSFGSYIGGCFAVIGIVAAVGLGGYWLRRWIVPEFSGALARLADATIAVALLVLSLELLGTLSILTLGWIVVFCIGIGLLAALLGWKMAGRDGHEIAAPQVQTVALLIALGVASFVVAEWSFPSQLSVDQGMFGGDTTWYHMPFAARMAQEHSTVHLLFTDPLRLAAWFYPQSSELIHASAIVIFKSDWLSPLINLAWLAIALLGAWCVGRPYKVGPATLVAAALVLDSGVMIETQPGIQESMQREFGFRPDFEAAKHHLEANDGAGNTFKATAKPVLIGTAVVGATTMIFSIIVMLTNGLTVDVDKLSILHPQFLLGLIMGGAVIYWFTGAATQAVATGAYRAVEFIKQNIKLDIGSEKASVEDSKRVVEICTQYAQKGMFNIFLTVFFSTLAFACFEPYFFIGYLISIALFGLYQAIFMANAGGAWDNAKKIVEVELKQKGTPLHAACVVGDTVGDPFKDTSSVAMNPVIKFTTLFGLLAVELAVEMTRNGQQTLTLVLSAIFLATAMLFVWRSFYRMRIGETLSHADSTVPAEPRSAAAR